LPTITLASGSTAQTVTAGSSITPVIYTTANATDASASDLPAGVTGSWDTNTYTINGTPTYANTYNYTVTPTNTGCTNTTATGTITVNCSNCAEWTTCNGFTQISNVSYENNKTMDFWTGKFYCENKGTGWRLPTKDELICMCNNRDALPGGYVYNGDYWSDEYYWRYYVINFGGCWDNTPGTSHSYYIKCVK
jgi:hypothetical protein